MNVLNKLGFKIFFETLMRVLMKEDAETTSEQCDFRQVIFPIRVYFQGKLVPIVCEAPPRPKIPCLPFGDYT